MDAMKDKWPYVMLAMTILSIPVVGGFLLFTGTIGGGASQYHRELGQWYVENHGVYTEVGETIWKVVYVWEIVFRCFFPVYAVVACINANIEE